MGCRVYIVVSVADRKGRRRTATVYVEICFECCTISHTCIHCGLRCRSGRSPESSLDIPTRLQFGAFQFGHSNSSSVRRFSVWTFQLVFSSSKLPVCRIVGPILGTIQAVACFPLNL